MLRLSGQLVLRQAQCLAGEFLRYPSAYFEEHPPGTDNRHPVLGRTLTFTHSGFSRLLGDRLIRKNANPHLTGTLHVTGHRDTSRLNLTTCDPPRLKRLNAEEIGRASCRERVK